VPILSPAYLGIDNASDRVAPIQKRTTPVRPKRSECGSGLIQRLGASLRSLQSLPPRVAGQLDLGQMVSGE
jgi:hypothetical protein